MLRGRPTYGLLGLLVVLAVLAPVATVAPPAAAGPGPVRPAEARLVVRLADADAATLRAASSRVSQLGGRVTRALPLVDALAVTLPATAVTALRAHEAVVGVTADRPVRVQSSGLGDGVGPLAPRVVRAPAAWAAGATGRGVTVALVDTGVEPVADLEGRIVPVHDDLTGETALCHDMSGEDSCRDSYGHGTFMAGLIAGDGAGGAPTGTAPEARVLSVKVAGASGAADVSTVLAAIQWVVSFRDRYGIGVLNLSLGTDSTASWQDDPLNYAVERAWEAGITVVVAAANTGPAAGSIAKPADDPYVVTVGAVDPRGTLGTGDDRLPDFSSRGPTRDGIAKPDVVAPGAHVQSLRVPGSTLDQAYPPSDPDSPYRTGSGTSMAAAVVSGVAAAALQAHPALTPDQLKHALMAGARPVASDDPTAVGAGLVDASQTAVEPAEGSADSEPGRSTGSGDLGLSRGSLQLRLDDPHSTLLTGRQTAQLLLWDPVGFTTGSWTAETWYASPHALLGWNTAHWATADPLHDIWTGNNWTGNNWTGNNWTGNNWTGVDWTGSSWYDQHDSGTSYGRAGPGSASYGAWD